MIRTISHSEVDALLGCPAKHAFAYTGRLSDGDALSPVTSAPILRDGRAWGAGVAAYHAQGLDAGYVAIRFSLEADKAQQLAAGVYDPPEFAEQVRRLVAMLDHYASVDQGRMALVERERELLVAIPSRGDRRRSTRFRLHAFIDGVHIDAERRVWLVEFKLRGRLQPLELIVLSRQIRWYAWAWRAATGNAPCGVIVDERLNELPEAVRHNKDGSVSRVQSCAPRDYVAACADAGAQPDRDVLTRLESKVWQARHRILFRRDELDEAGRQLTSSAQLVSQMDSGLLYPTRNPGPQRCPWCAYRQICADPADRDRVDALFSRKLPKRLRPPEEVLF